MKQYHVHHVIVGLKQLSTQLIVARAQSVGRKTVNTSGMPQVLSGSLSNHAGGQRCQYEAHC